MTGPSPRAVVLILDGLRRDLVTPERTPHLLAFAAGAERFDRHAAVFPSVTRVSAASIATGCRPARHGLQGNCVALREDGRLVRRDVGKPEFFAAMRRAHGRTLRVPTLAERLARAGRRSVAFSNVSPGAAYALDPDGHGHVYHRAGSYAPGLRRLPEDEGLRVTGDPEGDVAMTARACALLASPSRPDLLIVWLGEPDHAQHANPLGSPAHWAALATADGCVARIAEACAALGDDTLLVVGSDHGHRSIRRAINIDRALAAAGLKDAPDSSEVVVAGQGTSALIYLDDPVRDRREPIARFLAAQDWVGAVLDAAALRALGLDPDDGSGLALGIDMRAYDEPNQHGVPGVSDGVAMADADPYWLGNGNHGGLAAHEVEPFLMIRGHGFAPGAHRDRATSLVDIAPTVLRHLGLPADGCDGAPLQADA